MSEEWRKPNPGLAEVIRREGAGAGSLEGSDLLSKIISGDTISEFTEGVDEEAKSTGLPPALILVKKLASRAMASGEAEAKAETQATPPVKDDFVSHARAALDKRRAQLKRKGRLDVEQRDGEAKSKDVLDVMMVPLDAIKEDAEFANTRLYEDILTSETYGSEGHTMESLEVSMNEEGLKVPIVVRPNETGEVFFIRAGFRRVKCARKLGWKEIPSVVLPFGISDREEYWVNILENSTRKSLRTYEMAHAAQLMRDRFGVPPEEFALKTGYSVAHIKNLLCCIDRLPDELVEQWKLGARLPFDQWHTLALLEPQHAIRYFRRWTGQGYLERQHLMEGKRADGRRLAPAAWLDRMQKLYIGLEGSELEPRTRQLCLKVVEFCQGAISNIPGVYEPHKRSEYERRARIRNELKLPELPEPGTTREMPAPVDVDVESHDDDDDKED